MKRTTNFVRNFHFGNTIEFMANKTKEFIIYTAECMRAYFGVCDKENGRWKITYRKIISTPLLRKIHYADRKLTISSHTRFATKNQQEKQGKKKIAFLILFYFWKQNSFRYIFDFRKKEIHHQLVQCYSKIILIIRL